MPIHIQDVHEQEDTVDCPLCMEVLEVDDINFFPCQCGYQVCRFCWHRIRTDENGLCPACRMAYPENPAEFKPLSEQELQKIRQDKKQKEVARRQKITDSRKHLANVRVLQKNLVFVVGLSQRLADVDILKRPEYFGKYGKILKVVLNSNTSYAGSQTPSCSAYVTYSKIEESLRAIQSVNNVHIDGRTLKASLGTTKYCSNYLKNQLCQKHDCMYLHEIGDEDASFTKEDMQMAKHQEYEQKLIQQMMQKEIHQELKNKASRQETNSENGIPSAGSSPPTGASTITSGLSVAQAVMKNTKMAAEDTENRPRRHSSSSASSAPPDVPTELDFQGKNSGKGPKLSSSVGDRDSIARAITNKNGARRAGGKKGNHLQNSNQAPRHKKQQQLQQQAIEAKQAPSRAHSASPPGQNSEPSPTTSLPASSGASVESSPAATPLRDIVTSEGEFQRTPDETKSEDSQNVGDLSSAARPSALPIDIPVGSDDKNRDTPHSDSSSSVGRKSPFVVTESFSRDTSILAMGITDNNIENHTVALARSNFMMLHKEIGNDPLPGTVSNGLGYAPFGMTSHPPGFLQSLQTTEIGLPAFPQPISRVMPPPGLSSVPPGSTGVWPASNSHISDSFPVENSHDWEAAFGFKSVEKEVVSSADDDLGFDPWLECSKGLADLMEKEKTQGTKEYNRLPVSSAMFTGPMQFSDLSAQRRPTQLQHQQQHQNQHRVSQMGYSGGSDLVNGFSNLFPNTSQPPPQHRMPFQLEQSRFLSQQRHANTFPNQDPHSLLGNNNMQRHGFMAARSPLTPTKDLHGNTNPGNNIQDWQNGLRALLPSVNINFANQTQTQRPTPGMLNSSLGLSNLGMGMPTNSNKTSGIPHPSGISNSFHQNPYLNKQHVMPPPGVGFGGRSPFMGARPQQPHWGSGLESSMSTPGPSSNRLLSPVGLQSLFASGMRSESNPGTMPSYPPDPAIIQGGMPRFGPSTRRTRLFENPQNKPSLINSNGNGYEEQPHWMKSLQTLTEPDSPVSPLPQTSANSALGQLFSQQRSNVPSWQTNVPGLFSNSGFGHSQPPPGFQVRPSLAKPTEFGMLHSLLENQS